MTTATPITEPLDHLTTRELAARLGVDEVVDVSTTVVDYPLESMTTGGRWWVSGRALSGSDSNDFRLFVKLVRSVSQSPVMQFVPPHLHDQLVTDLPWRVEPDAYESDLGEAMPPGTRLPRVLAVQHLDDDSAHLWLEAVEPLPDPWTTQTYAEAARALGRLAASAAVAEVADPVGHVTAPRQARQYWEGRLRHQFADTYRAGDLWTHPVLAAHVTPETRDRLLALLDAAPAYVEEIEDLPLLSGHGDACPNNLLTTPEGFVVIDWGFFGRHRLGFDLSQLVMSTIDLGSDPGSVLPQRQATVLEGYRAGLADNGLSVSADDLARAHHVLLAIGAGVSAIPLERLGDDPAVLEAHLLEQLTALDHILTPLGL